MCRAGCGLIERAAVNRGVRADLDIVFDDETSDLWKLLVAAGLLVTDVSKALAAQHRSGLHDDAVAKNHAAVDCHISVNAATRAECDSIAEHAAGPDGGFIARFDVLAENRARADGHPVAEVGGRRNDGGRMDSAITARVAKQFCGASEGQARLRRNQQWLAGICANAGVLSGIRGKIASNDGGGTRCQRGVNMLRLVDED